MTNSIELEVEQAKAERMPVLTAWQVVQKVFNTVNHILIVIVAGYMTCLAYNTGNLAISWHALLCTLGVSGICLPLHGLLMWHFFSI